MMIVEKKENGDFTIAKEANEKLSSEEENIAIAILWHVPDMELLGEQGCAGNFDMYQYFYNSNTDKKYMVLLGADGYDYVAGKKVLLSAMDLDAEDRKMIEEEAKECN